MSHSMMPFCLVQTYEVKAKDLRYCLLWALTFLWTSSFATFDISPTELYSIIPCRFSAGTIFAATVTAVSPRAGKDKIVKRWVLNPSGAQIPDLTL